MDTNQKKHVDSMTCHIRFGTNFKGNTTMGGLAIVDSLGTSLNVTVYTMVVAGGEGV